MQTRNFLTFLISTAILGTVLLPTDRGHAGDVSLTDFLKSDEGRARLDAATRNAPERFDKVTLVHLGKESDPVRRDLIQNAENHIFMTSPYWFPDHSGLEMLEEMKQKRASSIHLDMRIYADWLTPLMSRDPFKNRLFKELRQVTIGQLIYWNPPSLDRLWSLNLAKRRLHDKMIIVDGKRLLLGGMNMGDTYLLGGLTREGWHDTDVLIEGETAQDAQRVFLKNWYLTKHLESSTSFPQSRREQIRALQDIYYRGKSRIDLQRASSTGTTNTLEFPFDDYEASSRYFPDIPAVDPSLNPEDRSSVRFLFDHPFVDRDENTGKVFSKTRETLKVLFENATKRVRIFLPYLTLTKPFKKSILDLRERGVPVEVITNSMVSHDLTTGAYYGAFSHYPELLHAGVRIFEWMGHEQLLDLEKKHGCTIPEGHWPGSTLHTKMVIVDGEAVMIGSHNMNTRSEAFNTESMALIIDERFAAEAEEVFYFDLDSGEDRTIPCGGRNIERPRRVREATLDWAAEFFEENRGKIFRAAKRQALM